VKLIKKIDEITFLANVNGKVIVVFEWENMLALGIHLKEKALDKPHKPLGYEHEQHRT